MHKSTRPSKALAKARVKATCNEETLDSKKSFAVPSTFSTVTPQMLKRIQRTHRTYRHWYKSETLDLTVKVAEEKFETELTLRNVESELGISSFNLRLTLGLSEETSTMMLFRTANALRSKFPELLNLCVKAVPRLGRMRGARRLALLTNTITIQMFTV